MQKYLHSSNVTYDPDLHLAQEFITVAHHQNGAQADLSKRGLTIHLPLNAAQIKSVKQHQKFWY